MKPNIELHIEELVLNGFAQGNRHHIAAAAERELSRLFTERGMPRPMGQGREAARLDGGVFTVEPGSTAEATGAQVARAVYGGLS